MSRHCTRTGCAESAASTLTYHYRRAQVWIDDLTAERDPHAYDLCARHTDRVSVPAGWQLHDRRRATQARATQAEVSSARLLAG